MTCASFAFCWITFLTCSAINEDCAGQELSNLENPPAVVAPAATSRGIKLGGDERVTKRTYMRDRGVVVIETTEGSKKEEPYVTLSILFKVDSAELLNEESKSNLRRLAEFLQKPELRDAKFCIEGHTSSEGTQEHNMVLSERRARRVCSILTSFDGVNKAGLRIEGFGPDAPEISPEKDEADRVRNRRVLIVREQ